MDQLRTALNWLKQYHFWVLSVVVAVVAIASWYSAAGKLSKEFQANQATIQREFSSQRSLTQQPSHANEEINRLQQEEITKQAKSVQDTWDVLYKRQQDEALKWPMELDETFRNSVESLKFEDDIRATLRYQYSTYIKNHFPKLPKIVNAKPLEARGDIGREGRGVMERGTFRPGALGRPDAQQDAEDDNYLVDWLDQDQAHVQQELQFSARPSSLQIWVTQENLWVYRTLLQVIADTNEGADRRSNAAVRVIESLEVGQAAAAQSNSSGRIFVPQESAGVGGMGENMGARFGPSGGAGFRESPSFGESGAMRGDLGGAEDRAALLSGRYLDKNGQPISAAGSSAGTQEFGVEYKRLPVRMKLQMDQRAVPKLIANCANQPLQVEVQQVQINPSGAGSGGSGQSNFRGDSGSVRTFDSQPNIAEVVIHGIIYVLNEPNTTTLQTAGT